MAAPSAPLELRIEAMPLQEQLGFALFAILLAIGILVYRRVRGSGRGRGQSLLDLAIRCLLLALTVVVPLAFSKYQQDPLYQKAYTVQFLTSLLIVLCATRALRAGRLAAPRAPWLWPLAGLVGWSFASLAWSPVPLLAFDSWVHLLMYAALFWIVCVEASRPRRRMELAAAALAGATCVSILALGQYYGYSFGGYIAEIDLSKPLTTQQARGAMAATIGHNLGTSGQAYFGLGFSLFLLAACRSWPARLALCATAGLHLLVLLRTLSRVYWVGTALALLVLGLLLLVYRPWRAQTAAGGARRRVALRIGAGAAAVLLVFLAFVAAPSRSVPGLRQRLADFDWDTIRSTTQLRVNAIGLYMLQDRPWLGTGLEGFKYFYPDYQGGFFAAHPYSRLRPSTVYTLRAHNDVLQLGIELGVAGIALLGWFVALHLRAAWAIRALPRADRIAAIVLYSFVSGMLLVAVGYFPFHEPPVALHTVLGLGLLGALLYAPPLRLSTGRFSQPEVRRPVTAFVACAGTLLVLLNTAVRCAHILQADARLKLGSQMADMYLPLLESGTPEERRQALDALVRLVKPRLDRAVDHQPYRGDIRWSRAKLLTRLLWHEVSASGHVDVPLAERILNDLEATLASYRFGDCYYVMGQIQSLLAWQTARVQGPAAAEPLYEEAEANLRRACRIIPRNIAALHYLGNMLWERGQPMRAVQTWQKCFTAPDYLREYHTQPAREAEAAGQLGKAENALKAQLALVPGRSDSHFRLVRFYLDHATAPDAQTRQPLDPDHNKARKIAELALERRREGASRFGDVVLLLHLRLGEREPLRERFFELWDICMDQAEQQDLLTTLVGLARGNRLYDAPADIADELWDRLPPEGQTYHTRAMRAELHWLAGRAAPAAEGFVETARQSSAKAPYDRLAAQSILTYLLLPPSLSLSL